MKRYATAMNAFFIFSAKYAFIVPIVVLGVYFFSRVWPAQKRMAAFALPAGVLTFILGYIGGRLYYDPRPFVLGHFTPLIAHASDNGFPSDHTLLVAALASVGMYWDKRLGVVLWLIAILVAFSRVYVGVHHAIDVIGSMILALVATSIWLVVMNHYWKPSVLEASHN